MSGPAKLVRAAPSPNPSKLYGVATRFRLLANRQNVVATAGSLGGEISRTAARSAVALTRFRVMYLVLERDGEQFTFNAPGDVPVVMESTQVRNPNRIRTYVEYPAGTFTAVTFDGGETNRYGRAGDLVISDLVTVAIPANTTFWLRNLYESGIVSNNGLIPMCYFGVPDGGTLSEGSINENPLTDADLNDPAAVFTGNNNPFAPIGVVADSHPSGYAIAVIGDSVADGNLGNGIGWPELCFTGHTGFSGSGAGVVITHDGTGRGLLNLSLGNMRAAEDSLPHFNARRMEIVRRCTDVVIALGTNDLAGARTQSQLQADLTALIARAKLVVNRGTGRVHVATIPPRTTSTDSWVTSGANQTVAATETDRVTTNTWIRTVPTGVTSVIEIADALETSRNSGKWKAPSGVAQTDDGIHPNTAGRALIKTVIGVGPFT